MNTVKYCFVVGIFGAIATCASAVPVQFALNGHWYERVDAPVTWEQANQDAAARGGHLATITSIDENLFLTTNPALGGTTNYFNALDPAFVPVADNLQRHWLGGFKLTLTANPLDGWTWVNSEGPFGYENWARALADLNGDGVVPDMIEIFPGVWIPASYYLEPDNGGVTGYLFEDRLAYDLAFCPVNGKQWNDLNGDVVANGYVVEWDQNLPCVCPDGGATWWLIAPALLVIAARRRGLVRSERARLEQR